MGAGNVKAVFVHWGDLPGGPFRLLAYMALRTRDADTRPQYWAGREDLAFGLGRRVPDDDDTEETRKARAAAFKATKEAMAVLVKRGAVRVAERARPGRNAVYELNLTPQRGTDSVPREPVDNPAAAPVENPEQGTDSVPHMGHGFPPKRGTVSVPDGARFSSGMGYGNRPPKEEEDESGLNRGGDSEGFPQPSTPSTAPPAKTERDSSGNGKAWTYRAACEYLMTRPGDERDTAERLAAAELGTTAKREAVLTRAAAIAHALANGVPA